MQIEFSENLVEAISERRLIPFIGAGFSKNININIPTWAEAINQAAELLGYDSDILKVQGDYLQIAEYLDIKRKLGQLYSKLDKEIDNPAFQVADSLPHLLLPYIDAQSIYTTNWDCWIEEGFKNQQIPFLKIVSHEDFVKPEIFRPTRSDISRCLYKELKSIKKNFNETAIVKFHGDFGNHASIVFKESHYYDRLDFEHPLDIKLRSDMIGKSMLFIGYSFSDPNIRYVWHKLNKMMKNVVPDENVRSFFVTHLNNPLLIEVFKKKNIETILLNPRNVKEDIQKLFEQIIEIQMK